MDPQKFGAFIKNCRKDTGMTQSELGAILNVTDKAISRWERGIGFPDIKLLEPLANALQITVVELMNCERENPQIISANTSNKKTGSWFRTHCLALPAVCFLLYMLQYILTRMPMLTGQLYWLSTVGRILFFATVGTFLYASYKEDGHGFF